MSRVVGFERKHMSGINWHDIFQAHRMNSDYGTTHLWIEEGEPVPTTFRIEEFVPVFKILAAALVHLDVAKYIVNLPKEGIPWLKKWYGSLEIGNREIVQRSRRSFQVALGIDDISVETGRKYTLLTLVRGNRAVQFVLRRLIPTGLMEVDRADCKSLEHDGELETVLEITSSWDRRRLKWDFGCFQEPIRWASMMQSIENGIQGLIRPEVDIDFEFMYDEKGLTTFTTLSTTHNVLEAAILMLAIARYRPVQLVKQRKGLPFEDWALNPRFVPHARKWRIAAATPRVCLLARTEFSRWLEAGGIQFEELEAWGKSQNPDLSWFREVYGNFPALHRKSGFSYLLEAPNSPARWKAQPALFEI